MITTVYTENSVYEIDQAARRVRRQDGLNTPTANQERFSADDGWAEYLDVRWLHDRLMFVWAVEADDDSEAKAIVRRTHTSPVLALDGPPIRRQPD